MVPDEVACEYSHLSFAPTTTLRVSYVVAGASERWLYFQATDEAFSLELLD